MKKEVWKSIPNYEGLYEVSSLGRVKSLYINRCLNPYISARYYCVGLSKNGVQKNKRVHQLVAEMFLNHTPCGMKLVIDHINGNPLDNKVENLQLISQRQNISKMNGNFSSKYLGVSWDKNSNKWTAKININQKQYHLGLFNCELAASQAYQNKLKEII
jgi:hypothetical protein